MLERHNIKIVIIQNTFYHFETAISLYQTLLDMGMDVCFYICENIKIKNRFQQIEFLEHHNIKVYDVHKIPKDTIGIVVSAYSNPDESVKNIEDEIFYKLSKYIYISHTIDQNYDSKIITKKNTLCLSPISYKHEIHSFNLLDSPIIPERQKIDQNINIGIQGHFQHDHRDFEILNSIKYNDQSYSINLIGTQSTEFLEKIERSDNYNAFENLSELDFYSLCNKMHFLMPLIDHQIKDGRYMTASYSSTFNISCILKKPLFAHECFRSIYNIPGIYYNENNFLEQFEKMISISDDNYNLLVDQFEEYKKEKQSHNSRVIDLLLQQINDSNSIEGFYLENELDHCFDEKDYEDKHPETKDFYQPHCKNFNIDDKHRLFYHYMSYAFPYESQDILSFYKHNDVDKDFDHWFYREQCPQTESFLRKFCRDNLIKDRERLFYHYIFYGQDKKLHSNIDQIKHLSNLNIKLIKDLNTLHIDQFLPPHEKYIDQYNQRIKMGKEIAAQNKIAVVALARNCDNLLLKSIENIQALECKKLKIFIFENDSEDDTKNSINIIAKKYDNISFKSIDNGNKYLQDRSRERTNDLADYRNECQDWVKENCSDCDYVIVLDLDADLGFSIDGIYNSIGWFDSLYDVGGIASYSLILRHFPKNIKFSHYDTFATRLNDWLPTPEDDDQNAGWMKRIHPLIGSEPFHLYSCFGGLAVYKTEAFLFGRYSGELGSEHVKFHKDLHDNGYKMYLNPSSRFFSTFESYLNDQ